MKDLYGRLFTDSQLTEEEKYLAEQLPSMFTLNGRRYCQRCSTYIEETWQLPQGAYYCRGCIMLGRVRSDVPLFYFPSQPFSKTNPLVWEVTLTSYQKEVSEGLKQGVENKQNFLIHAVTGSGKTEMVYETVAQVISQGGQVCLASPRIDVCWELYKRIRKDFSCNIVLLHGESDPYQRSPLVISTTHQLLKFYKAFDLLIVDEVDAFPYVDNQMLYYGVDNAVKDGGVKVFLTATSTDELDKKVNKGELVRLDLARRFHGNPLVVPKMIWLEGLLNDLKKSKLPLKLLKMIREQCATNYPLLLFFPHIEIGKEFTAVLKQHFPNEKITFVSSDTENRLEIVDDFRAGKVNMLVTTTILERGVTFPCVDVFVLWANHKLYTSPSLVQISGRVGRALERPTGNLYFFHDGLTKDMLKAKKDIQIMNNKGGF